MIESDRKDPAQLVIDATDLYRSGKYIKAAEGFSEAAVLYDELAESTLSAEMKNNQCVSFLKANRPDSAWDAVRGTSEIFKQAGDRQKMAMALANEATALKDLGNNELAIEKFNEAAKVFRDLGETDLLLKTSQSLSTLKLKSRNIPGALFSMQEGLEAVVKPNLRQKILINLLKIPTKLLDQ